MVTIFAKLGVVFFLALVNSLIMHHVARYLGFKDLSYDNPASIALLVSLFSFVVTFLPGEGLAYMGLVYTLVPIVAAKEFYRVGWVETVKFWLFWILIFAAFGAIIVSLSVILY